MNLSRPAPHQLFAPESQTSSGGGLAVCGGIDTARTTPGNSSSVLAGPPHFLADNRSTPDLARSITARPGTPPARGFSVSPDRLLRRCLSGVRWHRYDENNLRLLSSPLSSSIHRAFLFSAT